MCRRNQVAERFTITIQDLPVRRGANRDYSFKDSCLQEDLIAVRVKL